MRSATSTTETSTTVTDACDQIECCVKVLRGAGYGLEAHEILEIVDGVRQEEMK